MLVLPQILVLTAVTTVVAILASWVYVAIAIAGLRGRALTARWIVGAGLRTLVAGIIQTAAVLAAFGLAILLGGPLALIVFLVLIVPAIYLSLRLTFWQYAIFDGDGIIPGLRTTWAITRGGVLRIAGWGLAIAGISLLVRIGIGVATALLRDDLAPDRRWDLGAVGRGVRRVPGDRHRDPVREPASAPSATAAAGTRDVPNALAAESLRRRSTRVRRSASTPFLRRRSATASIEVPPTAGVVQVVEPAAQRAEVPIAGRRIAGLAGHDAVAARRRATRLRAPRRRGHRGPGRRRGPRRR